MKTFVKPEVVLQGATTRGWVSCKERPGKSDEECAKGTAYPRK